MNIFKTFDRFLANTEWFGTHKKQVADVDKTPFDINKLILSLENMLDKEQRHLEFLIESKGVNLGLYSELDLDSMIDRSQFYVIHITQRIKEYKEYAAKSIN